MTTAPRTNHRDERALLSEAQRQFLDQPLIARLATIEPDGRPHVVPIWFIRDGEDIVATSYRATHKIRNLERDSRCALSVGGDPYGAAGYLVAGTARLEPDGQLTWTHRILERYEPPDEAARLAAEWADAPLLTIRIKVDRIVSI